MTTTIGIENNIIEAVNENIHNANLVKECIPGALPDMRHLEQQWKETTQTKEEVIKQLSKLDWETY